MSPERWPSTPGPPRLALTVSLLAGGVLTAHAPRTIATLASTEPPQSQAAPTIVFDSSRAGSAEIFVIAPDGTGLRQLTFASKPGEYSRVPDWSPDCSQIAFPSNRDDPDVRSIYVTNADGSHVRRLTHGPARGQDILARRPES